MRSTSAWIGAIVGALLAASPLAAQQAATPMFRTSDRCMACHNGLVTPSGRDVSIGADWRASMMANAARDPYWQAAVRRETVDHPETAAAIQAECSICHMPMMHTEARATGVEPAVFAHLPAIRGTAPPGAPGALAADGVGCAMCHRISAEGLGTEASFVGGFVVRNAPPAVAPEIFGPFDVDAGRERIMRSATGFRPTRADHLASSETCATCHTLYTHAFGPGGEVVGELPEQVPYLEWLHSDYAETRSCASCHMPVVSEPTAVSSVWGRPREAVNRHSFRGGNFFMARIFNRYADDLGVAATAREIDVAVDRTLEHLRTRAATIAVAGAEVRDGVLAFEVLVDNLAGHKLPTAYPSRRVWLHVAVRGPDGTTVFESGAPMPDGRVAGNDNDADAARYEPHWAEIRSADQVQVYEAILAGPGGEVTTGLLTAVRYVKDNRVPPDGFDPATAGADIAVRGRAADDPDFGGGSDRVRYVVDLAGAAGPFEIDVELLYQPVGYRWARNLEPYGSEETDRFVTLYDSMAGASTATLATGTVTVP